MIIEQIEDPSNVWYAFDDQWPQAPTLRDPIIVLDIYARAIPHSLYQAMPQQVPAIQNAAPHEGATRGPRGM